MCGRSVSAARRDHQPMTRRATGSAALALADLVLMERAGVASEEGIDRCHLNLIYGGLSQGP